MKLIQLTDAQIWKLKPGDEVYTKFGTKLVYLYHHRTQGFPVYKHCITESYEFPKKVYVPAPECIPLRNNLGAMQAPPDGKQPVVPQSIKERFLDFAHDPKLRMDTPEVQEKFKGECAILRRLKLDHAEYVIVKLKQQRQKRSWK